MDFRKKSVVIQAVQFTQAVRDAYLFEKQPLPTGVIAGRSHTHPGRREVYDAKFFIETLEGRMSVSLNDWIITGVKGEHYSCKPDIFAATYEPAEQSPQAPCGESIDSPEFSKLLEQFEIEAYSFGSGNPNQELDAARAALIAHIDAKLTEARRVTEGWIDLKDQKPKDWQRVLVALNTGTVCEGYRGSVGWNWAETDHPDDAEATATHWKPWPKHPGATPSPDKG